MWGWIRKTKNCSAMHRGIALHLFNEEIPPSSLPSLYRFTTWLLVLLVASSSNLSLHDVDCSVRFFSCIHKVLLIMTQHHFYPSSILFSLFIFLFATLSLHVDIPPTKKKIFDYWIISCCPTLSESFTSHLVHMVGDVTWLIVESNFLHCLFPLSLSWFIDV